MIMKIGLSMVLCALSLSGCYVDAKHHDRDDGESGVVVSTTYPYTAQRRSDDALPSNTNMVEASGYVVSAFAVSVDGEQYADLESFYTKELDRLPARMEKAGYDSSFKFDFDAEVGFSDLYNRMTVYLLAQGSNGYQAKTFVNEQGGFKTFLPKTEMDLDYKIRANKRIRIIVTKDSERKIFCYNFSAKETSAHFNGELSPVILDDFATDITAYDCQDDNSSGVVIPERT
jgi:hypothetical protein